MGEGRIVEACLTCPWHGYQYSVENGCSPPPFAEIVPTHGVRLAGENTYVSTEPLPLGAKFVGVPWKRSKRAKAAACAEFYIGWRSQNPSGLSRHSRKFFALGVALSLGLFFLAAKLQNPVDAGAFEFSVERAFEGIVMETLCHCSTYAEGRANPG